MISGRKQRDDIRADRELEAGKDFFRHGGPAEHVTALQYQHFLAGAGEIGGVGQAVVAAADDNHVVFLRTVGYRWHIFRGRRVRQRELETRPGK